MPFFRFVRLAGAAVEGVTVNRVGSMLTWFFTGDPVRDFESAKFPSLQFGDIILFGKSEHEILHAAVFIADDIVFTKNGSLESRPWMLMHLDQMKEYYPIPKEQPWMSYYRHKGY